MYWASGSVRSGVVAPDSVKHPSRIHVDDGNAEELVVDEAAAELELLDAGADGTAELEDCAALEIDVEEAAATLEDELLLTEPGSATGTE